MNNIFGKFLVSSSSKFPEIDKDRFSKLQSGKEALFAWHEVGQKAEIRNQVGNVFAVFYGGDRMQVKIIDSQAHQGREFTLKKAN
jgi:hypothetical protein